MRLARYLPTTIALAVAAAASVAGAVVAVDAIERRTHSGIVDALNEGGLGDWSTVFVDGLRVALSGTAPDEASRFRALSAAGTVVDATRVVDRMDVAVSEVPVAPPFSLEILRNDSGVSLIGLIPAATDREALLEAVRAIAGDGGVADFLESADFEAPDGWGVALDFGLEALAKLPRAKISVSPQLVSVTAISDSPAEQRRIETDLARGAPDGIRLALDIAAPRPVITPFTLRFLIDGGRARFDACSAHTEAGRTRILQAAVAAGLAGKAACRLGLGVPSPRWPDAAIAGIEAVAALGAATVTLSDTDVTLVAAEIVSQSDFDRVAGDLGAALPDAFSLTAWKLEPAIETEEGPLEFTAAFDAEDGLEMHGRLPDDRGTSVVTAFAEARFGIGRVRNATRTDETLQGSWTNRVLAALEALALLDEGRMTVATDRVALSGVTGDETARDEVARILSAKLGEATVLQLDIRYEEALDPTAALPSADQCVRRLNQIVEARQVSFEPGSATIDSDAADTLTQLAEQMKDCIRIPMEIGGHTDSQGREVMNLELSQARADAVLNALMARRVLTANLSARGYGETEPIADNGTEAGREANRRIEFKLMEPQGDASEDGAVVEDAAASPADTPDEATDGPDEQN